MTAATTISPALSPTVKKTLALALAAVMVCVAVVAAGCQQASSPSKDLANELDKLKSIPIEQILKDPSSLGRLDISSLLKLNADKLDSMADSQKAIIGSVLQKVLDFDYKVNGEKIDGDSATVNVTFTTYDFGGALKTAIQNVLAQALVLALSGGSQADIQTVAFNAIKAAADDLTEKTEATTVDIPMHLKDGKWQIDALSGEALDAILGGLASASGSLDSLRSSL